MKWGLRVSEKEFLPKTRAWVADYERWIAEGCPTPEEEAARKAEAAKATPTGPTFAEWVEKNPAPDLQKLVERAGRRYAASIGEEYDPIKHPGYPHITPQEWVEHDRAMTDWERKRRERLR